MARAGTPGEKGPAVRSARRALVVGHDHVAGLGYLGDALRRRGWVLEWFEVVPEDRFSRPGVEVTFPDPRGWDAVITLGAPWPRRDIESWYPAEIAFLREARASGVAVLGICFGAQLLAEACGGSVRTLDEARIGWFDIEPLVDGVSAGPWLHWNGDQLVPPAGAAVLARTGDGCAAFAADGAVGLQFHPEMTSSLLDRWLALPGGIQDERADRLRSTTAEIDGIELKRRVDALLEAVSVRLF